MAVKVGVIGCGKWGINHVRVYSDIDCDFVALSDPRSETKKLAKKFNVDFFSDYKDMLPLVDAVSIAVPTDMHYDVVKDCLEAGKHVIVEKPLTLSSERDKYLIELSKKNGVLLMAGYLFRFNASVKELKKRIKEIGSIQYITARYIHSSKPPRKDSGVIFNFATHLIDTLKFVLGEEPKSVYCKKKNFLSDEREDMAVILLDYGNFIAELEVSWLHPLKKRDMWIMGSKQKIYTDFLEQMMTVYPIEISSASVKSGKEINVEIRKNEPLKEELKQFCSDIENGKNNNMNGDYNITKICELCLESAKTGKEMIL